MDQDRSSPAHNAAEFGQAEALRTLHQLDADTAALAHGLYTPAMLAAERGHAACILALPMQTT